MTPDPEVEEGLRRAAVAMSSRVSALAIYAYLGIMVGLLMVLTGAPGLLEEHYGPAIRYWFGISSLVGGILLFVAAVQMAQRPRGGWWAGILGTSIFALWTLVLATTYGWSGIHDGFVIAHFNQPIPREAPRAYVPFVYQSLALLAILHVITLLRLGRDRRPVR